MANYLILVFNKRILFFKWFKCLRLKCRKVIVWGSGCFFNQLAHTVNSFFIQRLKLHLCGLTYGLPIKHVFFVTLVNKQKALPFFNDQVPRILSFARGHKSSSGQICCKDLSLAFLSKSLYNWVSCCNLVRHCTLELRQLLRLLDPDTIPSTVKGMDLARRSFGACNTGY